MPEEIPPPIFTLRGHTAGVTAITKFDFSDKNYLVSGDEQGNVIIWDLNLFRRHIHCPELCKSRIQSLKVINLKLQEVTSQILVAQSRNDGVQLYDLKDVFLNHAKSTFEPILIFPTYDSLFSRGDSISIDRETAILAYPSNLEDYLVTVRYIANDATTICSGTAKRHDNKNQSGCSVFDIILRPDNNTKCYNLFAGYGDGQICMYRLNQDSTGLNIDLMNTIDMGFQDFVSAFDVCMDTTIIAGSPHKEVIFTKSDLENSTFSLPLKRPGVSSIAIRPDNKLLAIATWSNTVELYSMKSKKHLVTLTNHQKRVESFLYLDKSCIDHSGSDLQNGLGSRGASESYLICCASSDGTISILSIY